jgi:hypothetical protein
VKINKTDKPIKIITLKNFGKIVGLGLILFGFSLVGYGQNFYKEIIPKTDIVSFGIGPSFIYADNGGQYRALNFEINPAASLSYTKKLNSRFAIKSTAGLQIIESGGNPSQTVQDRWRSTGGAFSFKGQAYYLDVMPTMYLLPFYSHMNRSLINLYGGLGIGLVHVNRSQSFSFDEADMDSRATTTTGYIPIRAGINFRLSELSDLALEGTILYVFSDNLDGNENFNRYNDHMAQAQIVFKRFLKPRNR